MKQILNNSIAKKLIIGFMISIAYLLLSKGDITLFKISDSIFIVGMIFLIVGLFRLTKKLNFYKLMIFGWKKLIEIILTTKYSKQNSKTGDYYSYKSMYNKSFKEFLISGLIIIAISILFVF